MATRNRHRRIIAVHPHVDLYGSDRVFLESVLALAPHVRGVVSKPGPLVEALRSQGTPYEIRQFPVLRKIELGTPAKVLLFVIAFVRATVALTWWLRTQNPSALYVSTVAAPEWLIAGRLSGTRVVCHVHENEPKMSRAASAVLLSPLFMVHLVIANSESTFGWIASSLGNRIIRRIRVIPNGVREPPPTAVAQSLAGLGVKRFVVVGRLTPRKGQDLAISAIALVRRAGVDARLTLVGDGYPGYEDMVAGLHALAADEGVSEVTEFVGYQDPAPYVAAADLVLVPSRVESFGLVAVEALLQGRPVVATRVGGLSEIISDGVTGMLVEPEDPRALADAIIRLLSDPEASASLAQKGRADARARFSIEAYSAKLRGAVLPGLF